MKSVLLNFDERKKEGTFLVVRAGLAYRTYVLARNLASHLFKLLL